jgi:hypothetical protein
VLVVVLVVVVVVVVVVVHITIIIVILTNNISNIVAIIIIIIAVAHWQKKSNATRERNSKKTIQFIRKSSKTIRKNNIVVTITPSPSSIAKLRFESITASAQHARNGGKTCSNTLQASAASPDAKNFPLPSNATEVTWLVWPLSSASC